jgi:hypothetical protein
MTGTSARNPIGIFTSKRAKLLAIKYNLDLFNVNAYPRGTSKYVTYSDVYFIVENLWLDHFLDDVSAPPCECTWQEHEIIYNKLKIKWPLLL